MDRTESFSSLAGLSLYIGTCEVLKGTYHFTIIDVVEHVQMEVGI
jgi:hypothetical protein